MEVAKEGSSREKLIRMLLESVAVGVGRAGLNWPITPMLKAYLQATDWGLCVTL